MKYERLTAKDGKALIAGRSEKAPPSGDGKERGLRPPREHIKKSMVGKRPLPDRRKDGASRRQGFKISGTASRRSRRTSAPSNHLEQ